MENYAGYVEILRKKLGDFVVSEHVDIKVSIIVPCYNVQDYIEKSLTSLVKQTLKEIEIICVDDGSNDATPDIIKAFCELDSRVKIIMQNNQKQGAARNRGIEIAQGEYIGFIDSDDWVDLDYYEKLYNTAKKYNSDIALADYIRTANGKTKKRLNIKNEMLYSGLDEKFEICKQAKNPCPTNKIYRTDMLKNNNIFFPEGVYNEDKIFTCKAVYYANTVVTVPDTYYYYYRRPNSTVKTKDKKHYQDKINANREVLDFLKSKKVKLRRDDFCAIKEDYTKFGIRFYTIKESLKYEQLFLFGLIPIKKKQKILYSDSFNLNDKITVVIPTLQKNQQLLTNLLSTLDRDKNVDEIILIDNSLKGFEFNSKKFRLVIPESNLYVNPSWNLGVNLSKNENIAILNDDITIPENFCTNVFISMPQNTGVVGYNRDYICETHNIMPNPEQTEIHFIEIPNRCLHWGVAIFAHKSSYANIPDDIKIYCGDDWLIYQSKKQGKRVYSIGGQIIYHYGSLSSGSKNMNPILENDVKLYKKLTEKWWQNLFNFKPLYKGFQITFLGINLTIHRGRNKNIID